MLDDYQESQKIIYKILGKAIKNDECSHAYLFETTGYSDSFNFIMAFVKSIVCPKKKTNKKECGDCHQCDIIESGNFPEIQIINPDGLWIKKEQLKELQAEFSEKALIGSKRVYIINGAEKLNKSSANSILKFLEEPEEGIIAILLTENIYGVLETIRSRCQILKLKEDKHNFKSKNEIEKIKEILYVGKENSEEKINDENKDIQILKVIEFVNYYEKHHLDTLLHINSIWNEFIKNKEDMLDAFDIMSLYYGDIINYKLGNKLEVFNENEKIKIVADKNDIKNLCDKLKIIMNKKQYIKYNANTNLLMDKLIIDLEGGI